MIRSAFGFFAVFGTALVGGEASEPRFGEEGFEAAYRLEITRTIAPVPPATPDQLAAAEKQASEQGQKGPDFYRIMKMLRDGEPERTFKKVVDVVVIGKTMRARWIEGEGPRGTDWSNGVLCAERLESDEFGAETELKRTDGYYGGWTHGLPHLPLVLFGKDFERVMPGFVRPPLGLT